MSQSKVSTKAGQYHYAVAKTKVKAHKAKKKRLKKKAAKKSTKGAVLSSHNTQNIYYYDRFAVLTYHHISNQESAYAITADRFARQLDALKSLGYNFISLEQASAFLDRKAQLPPNALVVTFDDGTDGFYRYAYPILKARHIPASMFVIVGYVGQEFGGMQCLSWQQMQEMQRDGFTFYSHTYDSHRRIYVDASETVTMPALVAPKFDETIEDFKIRVGEDLSKSKAELETNLGRPVSFLGLPYGMAHKEAVAIAKEAGYQYIFTVHEDLNGARIPTTYVHRFNAGSPAEDGNSIHKRIITKAPPRPVVQDKKNISSVKAKKRVVRSRKKSRSVRLTKAKKRRR